MSIIDLQLNSLYPSILHIQYIWLKQYLFNIWRTCINNIYTNYITGSENKPSSPVYKYEQMWMAYILYSFAVKSEQNTYYKVQK